MLRSKNSYSIVDNLSTLPFYSPLCLNQMRHFTILCLLSLFLHRALEYQIQELVHKLLDGQGLPLIKPPALRRMAGYEKTRVMVLRQLETAVGVRRPGELKMAMDAQILPVVGLHFSKNICIATRHHTEYIRIALRYPPSLSPPLFLSLSPLYMTCLSLSPLPFSNLLPYLPLLPQPPPPLPPC